MGRRGSAALGWLLVTVSATCALVACRSSRPRTALPAGSLVAELPPTPPGGEAGAGGEGGQAHPGPDFHRVAPAPPKPVLEPPPPIPPPSRDCGTLLNPPTATWGTLEGCTASFSQGYVTQERECTQMACGPELPCCNRCYPGKLAFRREREWMLLSRAGAPLVCKEGRGCDATKDCDAAPGYAEVTGTLWRRDGQWYLDLAGPPLPVAEPAQGRKKVAPTRRAP
jgi:hypothetical protein